MTAPFQVRLVLASSSPYRKELLARLGLPFETIDPAIDESAVPAEHPAASAERLAHAKAIAVAERFPSALIIGSDQVAYSDVERFGKPDGRAGAVRQLQSMRGKSIIFHTGICLLNSSTGVAQLRGVPTVVCFRHFDDAEIERYLDRETDAVHCAGSAKSEGLGIALLDSLSGDDPNALIGLPLIALCDMLRREGVVLP